jgi:hypothetical protein
MKNNLFIIARFNEELNWLDKLNGDIVIYNKGSYLPSPYTVRNTENIGRESESFVRSIIEIYDSLYEYENVIFLQGNPFDHINNLYKKLEDPMENNYLSLGDFYSAHQTPDQNYIFGNHISVIDMIFKELKNVNNFPKSPKLSCEVVHEDGRKYEKINEIYEIMGLCALIGLDYKHSILYWSCGSQYKVKKEVILSKSLDWWKELHSLIIYCETILDYHLGYILERIWALIWEHSDKNE